jgi:hypothetical protein
MLKSQIKDAYDDIEVAILNIKTAPIQKHLSDLQYAFNKFFSDSNCLGIIYTNNTDKLFFGDYIMPKIEADRVIATITSDHKLIVKDYYVELDSQLFNAKFGLTEQEITAMIVHDVGTLVNNSGPAEVVVKNLNQYLVDNKETLRLTNLIHYKEMLSFGFRDALRKVTSLFEIGKYDDTEDTMGDFIDWVPYKKFIISGMEKLNRQGQLFFNREVRDKFVVLSWVLRVYNDVVGYRIATTRMLDRFQELTPSQIEKKEMNNFVRRLNRIDDDMLLESTEETYLINIRNKKFPVSSNVLDCLDIAKNDLVGIVLKQENLDPNEPDAIPDLLHSINNSMTMIKDYAENNVDDKDTFKQWNAMFQELDKRRRQITKMKAYVPQRKMINTYKAQADQ